MKKIIIWVVVVAIIAGGGFLLWKRKTTQQKPGEAETKTVAVMRGPLLRNVQATGIVASKLDVEIKCKASGEIVTLPYDISATVKKGDLLLELDPTDEDRNVKKARVSLIQSQARLEQALTDLSTSQEELANSKRAAKVSLETSRIKAEDAVAKEARVKQLYEKKLASKEEYDTAHTSAVSAQADYEQAKLKLDDLKTQEAALQSKQQALKIAKAGVESDKISLSIAEQRLKETKVYSPIDGTITALNVQIGQIISSGINNVGGGTSIMTVSDTSRLYILASIDESDIGEIAVGQHVLVTADAYPRQMFRGVVDRIAQKGQNQSNVVTFEVRIEVVSGNKTLLKPEMTANVEIVIERKDDVLYVPSGAVYNEDRKEEKEAAAKGKNGKEAATSTVAAGTRKADASSRAFSADRDFRRFARMSAGRGGGNWSGRKSARAGGFPGGRGDRSGMFGGSGRMEPKLKQYVTVVNGDKKTVREVITGMTDGENIEIVSGLKEGEMVETQDETVQSRWSGDRHGPRGPMMMH